MLSMHWRTSLLPSLDSVLPMLTVIEATACCCAEIILLLTIIRDIPSLFSPHWSTALTPLPPAKPIPHTLSYGLASTMSLSPVLRSSSMSELFWVNLHIFIPTTMPTLTGAHLALSKPETFRPIFLWSLGLRCDVFNILSAMPSSPNSFAFLYIIHCSAVENSRPSHTNGDSNHWLNSPCRSCGLQKNIAL
ncbi:hypothetical protein BJX65DRAFT_49378 [Aspergillus insuetus]